MKNSKLLPGIFFLLSLVFGCNENKTEEPDFSPIIDEYLADPFIVNVDSGYFLYATGQAKDEKFIPIYFSRDLNSWEFLNGAVSKGDTSDWNFKNFWAPEVFVYDNQFYLYYTASPKYSPKNSGNRVGVAVSSHPSGPFKDLGPVISEPSLDGHPYKLEDGTLLMYYVAENGHSQFKPGIILVDTLKTPTETKDNPKIIMDELGWQEGPFITQSDQGYILTYSSGGWKKPTYHVRQSYSSSPLGPFKDQNDTIISQNDEMFGPGHHAFFNDNEDNLIMVFHAWDTAMTKRYPRMLPVKKESNKITLIDR
ncbi:family 43 glycosylhydrolase [Marinigracilibium pacificum]|uniref:Family 43 glycosylhydrolase n=1 Tax=Marinigracilibium pacificum TaxID=2729599 RepID=A0A848IYK8_9BACT|nr:family 43 glycosylhydrolase [Marinigracilibium pacificum]NMM48365.1 family 43 glycosylhydrolase [Marinigracilibium pacificum]